MYHFKFLSILVFSKLNFFSFQESSWCGEEALERKGILKLSYPTKHGVVTNWAEMVKLWEHVYKEIELQPQEVKILEKQIAIFSLEKKRVFFLSA